MKRLVFAALFVVIFSAPCLAQQAFTLEQVLSSPFPSELVTAPRGARVAWVFRSRGIRNIWVAEGPAFAARRLTNYLKEDGQDITDVGFSGDGQSIVYVRGGPRNSAGEVPNPTSDPQGVAQEIWVVALAGGAPRKIDSGNAPVASPKGAWVAFQREGKVWLASLAPGAKPKEVVARGQNSSPVWSPDGKRLAFVSNRGTHSFIAVYDLQKDSIQYVAPSVDRDSTPRFSPDGGSVAFIRTFARPGAPSGGPGGGFGAGGGRWTIWVANLEKNDARQIWQSGETPEASIPRNAGAAILTWAAGRIVYASEEDGWLRLYSMNTDGSGVTPLTPTGCEFEQVTFTPDRSSVVYSSNCGDIERRHIQRVNVAGGAAENVSSGEGIEWLPRFTADGKWIAYLGSDARLPAMPYVRAATASGPGKMLAASALPKDFPSATLVVPQLVIVKSEDGVECHNQLFLPADLKPGEKRPAVLFLHGGPQRQMMLGWHNRGYYHQAYAVNQYLASRGYVVMSVNYRSGIMYGRAFREAQNRGARGASEYQDVVAAGKYLASRADVDPRRIGLWGGSYGGYLTALGLARNSDIFAAGVDLHGVHDWAAREIGGPAAAVAAAAGAQGASRLSETAFNSSPVASVDKWRSPVLLVHGDDDRNVNFSQTIDLVARLRARGVPFEQVVYPDEVHDFLLFRNWLAIYSATVDFFDRRM
jgi:dipeptidyl aminopeptidase/acylaminoacyl peptidase